MIKKIFRIAGYTLLFILVFVGVYFLAAYVLSRMSVDREPDNSQDITMYILTNGVHTDLVVPVRTSQIDWSKKIPFRNTASGDSTAGFIAFGWGDKGFYLETPTWADLTVSTAFKAAFNLSSSAIHTTYYRTLNENERCRKIMISNEQYARLTGFISNSFSNGTNNLPEYIPTNAVYGANDAFYEATGKYNLFHTCNTWANNGLKSCGQKACKWTIFDTGIFYQYKNQDK